MTYQAPTLFPQDITIEYRGSGWWTATAIIGGYLVHVMCDYKPTKDEAEDLLIHRAYA